MTTHPQPPELIVTQQPDLVLVLDNQNQEHYINLNHVVEVHYYQANDQVAAKVVTIAPASIGSEHRATPYEITVGGEAALALRRQLRQRAGLPEDTEIPEPVTAHRLPQPTQQIPRFLTKR